ncbi:MAG: UDP-N-acetylmuramoyl-L-alanine--D-glutamate ligase [Bacillota bacterium]|jgi:UDP-N-acetylmuramoylalanine--D-glutamate ligase|nr:UDP-N-acetylmuramoyl-L-alanine--D-glutamate ligase [Bacillota bacterium]HHT90425.1 UDP-N-acetylmuramoyl-L-alanine--D-glutamate ligase [Bacillota bacterium]
MDTQFGRDWSGRRVAVIGLGISNVALIRFLKRAGAELSGRDQKQGHEFGEGLDELESLGIELILGSHYLQGLQSFDTVVVSPGVPKHLPELQQAARLGRLESEIGLVFRYSRAPIYGITGSSGKTTTTSLVAEMLKRSGLSTYVGGNIGRPLILELEQIGPQDHVLLELSSFQLEGLDQSPHGALITNIAQNHLDVHHTMDNYIRAKQNIYRHQGQQDFLVLNYDDPLTRAMAAEARGRVYFFSLVSKVNPGVYLDGDDLIYLDQGSRLAFARRSELVLPGRHNAANFLAAALFSQLSGANWQAIAEVGRTFAGVAHRLELVDEVQGVRYYNDSIATTPDRTIAALQAFEAPIILIAGGSDKKLSFTQLGEVICSRVKHLILLGVTGPKIRQAVGEAGGVPFTVVEDLGEALTVARGRGEAGDIVLLSPASASYDQYANFMARGEHFRALVQNLKVEYEPEGRKK